MPKKLLLADDSITIQKAVAITFAAEDYAVTAVDNGEEAVAKVRELRPDVVLADVVMPKRNGYEVCQALKSDPALKHIPVLLLAGTFEAFDEERARGASADGHIQKPFESQALIDRVNQLVQKGASSPAGAPAPEAAPAALPPAPAALPPARTNQVAMQGIPRPPVSIATAGGRPPPTPPGARPAAFSGTARPPPPGVPGAARPPVPIGQPTAARASGAPGAVRPPAPGVPAGARPPVAAAGARPPAPGAPGARPPAPGVPTGARPPIPGIPHPPGRSAIPGVPPPPPHSPLPTASRPARDPFGLGIGSAPPRAEAAALGRGGPAAGGLRAAPAPAAAGAVPAAAKPAPAADGGEALLREALSKASREVVEKIAWEVVPQLAELIIREELDRLIKEREAKA